MASQYHNWAEHIAQKWGVDIVDDPKGRRDGFVDPYFEKAQPDQVVVIIKAREPAGMMTAIGAGEKWHLETKYRWVKQYNFYIQDAEWVADICSGMPVLPILHPHLLEPALLAGREDEARRDSLYPKQQRLSPL